MCHGPMFNVGTKFRTPPKRDVKEWEKLRIWYVDSDVLSKGQHWVGRGSFCDTVSGQKKQFREKLKEAFDHKIISYGKYCRTSFPYVIFK